MDSNYRPIQVVEVKFKEKDIVKYYKTGGLKVSQGDYVIVEAERGLEAGQVISDLIEINLNEQEEKITGIKKIVDEADKDKITKLKKKAQDAMFVCEERVAKHKLNMKLVDANYSFDGQKLTFYFAAEKRIDFRELVRDLARIFKTRIELRQIGVRDETKKMGGLGPCGRVICCRQFLPDFCSVSIKSAKCQHLNLSPTKISGVCGRLMCCLTYEEKFYENEVKKYPDIGAQIIYKNQTCRVQNVNFISSRISIENPENMIYHITLDEYEKIKAGGKF